MSRILKACLKIVTGVVLMAWGFYWGSGLFLGATPTLGRKISQLSGLAELVIPFLIILPGTFCAFGGLCLMVLGFTEMSSKGGVK